MYPMFKCSHITNVLTNYQGFKLTITQKDWHYLSFPQQHYAVSSRGEASSPELEILMPMKNILKDAKP